MTDTHEGFGFISGRGRENAQAAIKAAVDAGYDSSIVRTVADGYEVPEKALKKYEESLKKASAEPDTEPVDKAPEKPAAKKPAPKKSK